MSDKTVFVIGAGASKEVDLPTGIELKEKISNLLNIRYDFHKQTSGDYCISKALRKVAQDQENPSIFLEDVTQNAWHIRNALPLAISIDNFIDTHRENEKIALCGKLAIVKSILMAEKTSSLFISTNSQEKPLNFKKIQNTWYVPFFKLITENCNFEELKNRFKKITLIIFNYDRCIEHFLINAIIEYYGVTDNQAIEVIQTMNIYHPYGSVGSLPWKGNSNPIGFGAEPTPSQLLELANQIKTFTEGTNPSSSNINKIQDKMREADKLVFLGFAFHKLNMKLIAPKIVDNTLPSPPECYATGLGISFSDREVIKRQINEQFSENVKTNFPTNNKAGCHDFFNEFWRSLSF